MAMRCRCPPDNLIPPSPTMVLSLLGIEFANSLTPASLAAFSISSDDAFKFPYLIFVSIVSLKSIVS